AVDAILGAAAHPSPKTRAAAMRALGQVPVDPRVAPTLRAGLGDVDPWVRYYACQALGRRRDVGSIDGLMRPPDHPAGQVRVPVVEALAHLPGARPSEGLRGA